MFSFLDRIRHVDGHNVSFLVQPFGHHAEMLASIPPIKQMHATVMPTPTDAVGYPQRLLHIALAAGDFRMFHEEQRPIRFSRPDAKPHRRRNNEFDHKTFLSTETIRQGATRRQIRRPGARTFAARSSLSCHNRRGEGKEIRGKHLVMPA